MRVFYFVFLPLFLLFFLGCAENDRNDDDSDVAPEDDAVDDSTADDIGDDDSADDDTDFNLSDPLGPTEVRAGRVTAVNELVTGPRARGEIGDYKLYNNKIAIIVRSAEKPGASFTGYAGNIIDADRVRPAGEPGYDNLQGIDHVVGIVRGFWAQETEVADNGHDGVAVIRVSGQDGGVQFMDSLLSANGAVYNKDYGLRIVNEYILEPDKDYITIRTTVSNDAAANRRVAIADMPFWGFETRTFLPNTGFNVGDVDPDSLVRWVGGLNPNGTPISYALAARGESGRLYIPYIYGNVIPSVEALLPVPAHGSNVYERLFVVGTGDAGLIAATLNAYDGNTQYGTLAGRLTLAEGGTDFNATRLFVMDRRPAGSNYIAMLLPDAEGRFSLQLNPGNYTLQGQGDGRADPTPKPFDVAAGETTNVNVAMDAPGFLNFHITDGAGDAIPCKITIQEGAGADPDSRSFDEVYSATGTGTALVKPGVYTVTASRGYEYEILQADAQIVSGSANTFQFSGEIAHSVDSSGWIATEFHIHGPNSTDSPTRLLKRITQLAAEGLEMPVLTEHDFIPEYSDVVEDAGLTDWLQPIMGAEISPGIGHFNAWPMSKRLDRPDFYGLPFMLYDEQREYIRNYEFPEMWSFAREDYSAQMVQINHPVGWLEYAGYDRTIGLSSADPTRFTTDFDAMEVFNGPGQDEKFDYWVSFIDQGINPTMHGNSDSHGYPGLANPRDLIAMPVGRDKAATADPLDFIANDKAHRAQVTNGPLIDISIGDQTIGGFVTGLGTSVPLWIRVQAPMWVVVDYLKVYSNHGEVVYEDALTPTGDVVRFEDTLALTAEADAWFVVEAGASMARLGPVMPGARTFAITNPIWVDVDGNGVFDPPGVRTD